jgi:HTH-type transcriptional regulator, glycine betaine synthesis regulator
MISSAVIDPPASADASLSAVEIGVIDFFVGAVRVLGLPKSIGEIYGLLFVSIEPQPVDTLCQRLNMSKGSASQGLKVLRAFGAVRTAYQPGDRRDHFTAEIEIKRLAAGFMREQIQPRLTHGEERLTRLEELVDTLPDDSAGTFQRERIAKLNRWSQRGRGLIPLIGGLLE